MDPVYILDEFGRNHFLVLGLSILYSLARGGLMTIALLSISATLAIGVSLADRAWLKAAVQALVDALESVPIYIWVLAAVSWTSDSGYSSIAVIFTIAGLPLAYNFYSGLADSIKNEPYFVAATALGAGWWRLGRYHLLPNILPRSKALAIHVLGTAIAVYGAVGLFGFVNREEFDLGVMLLRGKEQASFDLTLLSLAFIGYVILYCILYKLLGSKPSSEAG